MRLQSTKTSNQSISSSPKTELNDLILYLESNQQHFLFHHLHYQAPTNCFRDHQPFYLKKILTAKQTMNSTTIKQIL